jgi:glycosyltransferase involved in cell wall biosynthesis
MKVSVITVVKNCDLYISSCIESVLKQKHREIEYIIIDGNSTDDTVSIIKRYLPHVHCFISAPDTCFYSALNRGISMATGDVIGILNADDVLADADVISTVVGNFKDKSCDAVYGNLNYTNRNDLSQVTRKWQSNPFQRSAVKYGWMPPHPTIYIRREVYKKLGYYSLDYGHSSDYELILRFFYKHRIHAVFVDKLFVKMRKGGISNGTCKQLFKACSEDYRALIYNDIPLPLVAIVAKKLRKLEQYF